MRSFKLALSSLALLLALCAPALAQSSPADSQYVGEAPGAFTDNTGQGTDAVNDALNDSASSTGATSAQPGSASASDDTAPSEAGTPPSASPPSTDDDTVDGEIGGGSEQGLGSISELPETGGASVGTLGFGVLLVTVGLTIRRIY